MASSNSRRWPRVSQRTVRAREHGTRRAAPSHRFWLVRRAAADGPSRASVSAAEEAVPRGAQPTATPRRRRAADVVEHLAGLAARRPDAVPAASPRVAPGQLRASPRTYARQRRRAGRRLTWRAPTRRGRDRAVHERTRCTAASPSGSRRRRQPAGASLCAARPPRARRLAREQRSWTPNELARRARIGASALEYNHKARPSTPSSSVAASAARAARAAILARFAILSDVGARAASEYSRSARWLSIGEHQAVAPIKGVRRRRAAAI